MYLHTCTSLSNYSSFLPLKLHRWIYTFYEYKLPLKGSFNGFFFVSLEKYQKVAVTRKSLT